jgi:hypothetical protein
MAQPKPRLSLWTSRLLALLLIPHQVFAAH